MMSSQTWVAIVIIISALGFTFGLFWFMCRTSKPDTTKKRNRFAMSTKSDSYDNLLSINNATRSFDRKQIMASSGSFVINTGAENFNVPPRS
jgi:hypothetical protein